VIDFEGPEPPVKLPDQSAVHAAVVAAGQSTVQIIATGCDNGDLVKKGSGFVASGDLVVTNAHVVAGATSIEVLDTEQGHKAVTVLFDPEFDIAILRVEGLTDPPLRIDPHFVSRGTKAVVLGFPGGGPFDPQPAGVLEKLDATGFDIYNENETTRWVYELEAIVRPGNSGGPLVEPNGLVIGVVFSRSATNDRIGFALNSPGVLFRLHEAEREPPNTVVSTGRCTTG
jgi:S1-C subfamily serine protease